MGYALNFTGPVRRFLSGAALSRGERVRLYAHLHDSLGQISDELRADPVGRLDADRFLLVLLLPADAGGVRAFRFVVNDSAAPYGVLSLVYADEL